MRGQMNGGSGAPADHRLAGGAAADRPRRAGTACLSQRCASAIHRPTARVQKHRVGAGRDQTTPSDWFWWFAGAQLRSGWLKQHEQDEDSRRGKARRDHNSNRHALDLPVVLLSDDDRTSANPGLRATTWQGALKQRCRVSRFKTSMTRSRMQEAPSVGATHGLAAC